MSIILKGIDIPDEKLMEMFESDNHICIGGNYYPLMIKDVIQIPKNHGRIIDGDKLCKDFENDCSGECDCCIHETENYNCGLIANAPTILEAEE